MISPRPDAGRLLPLLASGLILTGLAACGGKGDTATAVVSAAPAFASQPADATAVAGETATFTAAASGNVAYQWLRNGVAIPGAIDASYTTGILTAADHNATFALQARTSGGTAVSQAATLRVSYATLTTHPFDTAVAPGTATALSVAAVGSGALSYQWTKDGLDLAGATGATLTLANPVLADSGAYACRVTNSLNGKTATATSRAAILSVAAAAPVITSAPADTTVLAGQTATFIVTASNGLAYQWLKNGLPIEGATAASYTTLPAIGGDDTSTYAVRVSNPLGQVTSPAATLHVNYLRVATQPADALAVTGNMSLTFGVGATVAEGATNLTFAPVLAQPQGASVQVQWSKDGTTIPGATLPTLMVPAVSLATAGAYACSYTSTLNGTTVQAQTAPAQIQVVGLPVLTAQPQGLTSIVGKPATLSVTATQVGSGVMSYQWFRNGVALTDVQASATVTAVTGTKLASLYIQSLATTDTGDYTCRITNTYRGVAAVVTSQAAHLEVNGAPQILTQPASLAVTEGRPASFTLSAQGPGTLTYTWFRGSSALPNSNSPTYAIPATVLGDSGATFHCVVSNGVPPDAVSQTVTLTVNPLPAAPTLNASTQLITKGQGVVFTYLFDPAKTATFGPQGGTAVPVTSGGATTVYPDATSTYTLAVAGLAPVSVPVTVKTYTPKVLYIANGGDNNLWQYPVNVDSPRLSAGSFDVYDDGRTTPANALVGAATTVRKFTGAQPFHMASTFDERFVFVCNLGDATLSVFSVNAATGGLTEVAGSPFALPAGYTKPWCSAPDPAAAHLYVACAEGVAVFDIDGATGALTVQPTKGHAIPGRLQGELAMHPSGKYLYVCDPGHSAIRCFAIDGTGALSPNGADMAVTFASGWSPSWNMQVYNPSNLAFDRSGSVLFTRSNDALVYAHGSGYEDTNGAYDSYQVDPYTGVLGSHQSSQSKLMYQAFYLVNGDTEANHGLVFSATPGVNHLIDTYKDQATGWFGPYMSTLDADLDPASATYGQVPGYYADLNYSSIGQPRSIGSYILSGTTQGAVCLIQDRSGRVLVPVLGPTGMTTSLIVYGSNAQGSQAFMGSGLGETPRATGTRPMHGLFLGSLN